MNKIFKIITDLLLCVVLILIFIMLFGYFQIKVIGKKNIEIFGYTFFEVVSGSMSDTINVGDAIIVKTMRYDINEGDIITFIDNDDFITHRIISMNGDIILTKGDANNSVDKSISKKNIIGKVVKIIPEFGIYRDVLLTPKVLISLSVTLLLFSIYFETRKKKEE